MFIETLKIDARLAQAWNFAPAGGRALACAWDGGHNDGT